MIITWSGRDRSLEINLCAPWSLLLHRMPKIPDCNNLLKCRRGKNLKKSACPCNHHSWPRDNSCRKGVCGNARFLHGYLDVFTHHAIKKDPLPMWKSQISQLSASSEPGKHLACGLVLLRPWWCTLLGNVWFPHGHGFLLYLTYCYYCPAHHHVPTESQHQFETYKTWVTFCLLAYHMLKYQLTGASARRADAPFRGYFTNPSSLNPALVLGCIVCG